MSNKCINCKGDKIEECKFCPFPNKKYESLKKSTINKN